MTVTAVRESTVGAPPPAVLECMVAWFASGGNEHGRRACFSQGDRELGVPGSGILGR